MISGQSPLDSLLELTVNVLLREIRFLDNGVLSISSLLNLRGRKSVGLVCTFSTPRDIMPIAEGVNIEDVDVG